MHESLDAPVVLAFADLVDSTALLARLGDARNDEIRQDFFSALRVGIARCHGREIKTQGDGFMVTFQFAGDAVRCAALWHRSLARLAARPPGLPLALRVGIAAGDAIFDEVEDDWFGTAVVEAARLCSLAPTSGTLVTPAVRDLDDGRHPFTDFGAKILKGFPDPMQLWLVGADPADPDTASAAPSDGGVRVWDVPMTPLELDLAGLPPLEGRVDERNLLSRILAAPARGEPRLVRVTGEAGIGASRLVAEALSGPFDDPSMQVLYGRASAGRSAFGPVLDAIRGWVAGVGDDQLVGLEAAEPLRRRLRLLDLRLGELADDATRASRGSAQASGASGSMDGTSVDSPASTVSEASPETSSAIGDLVAFLVAIARRRPLILVIDDADTLDQSTVALLDSLLETSSAVTVVLSHRGIGEASPLSSLVAAPRHRGDAHEIRLDPLDEDATTWLVTADLQRRGLAHPALDPSTAKAVHDTTGGRPERILAFAHHLAVCGDIAVALGLTQPYKGLIPFGGADRSLFFGRTVLTERCVDHFATRGVLVLVGNSGSGKSSLLHAGILPTLAARGLLEERELTEFRVTSQITARLTARSERSTVWVIDQFEELFTAVADVEERTRIAAALIERLEGGDGCILALRGDFYGHLASLPHLAELVDGATVLVGPPTEDDLHEIIQAPAQRAGVAFEAGLVEKIVAEVAAAPGGLPLLSHALYQTWNRQRDATLTVASYDQAGGAEGSIAATAEHVYESRLDADGRRLARLLFRSLVNPTDGGPDTRRRMSTVELGEFRELAGSGAVIDELLGARLVTVDGDGLEVAHEAIISAWPRLRGWIDEERSELVLERRIAAQAAAWERSGRQEADLLRLGRLAEALAWEADRSTPVAQSTKALLDASVQLRDETAAKTARQLAEQRRANRRLRLLLAFALVLIAGVGVLIAITRSERDRATRLAGTANAQVLAEQAIGLADTDPTLARLLAVEAHARSATPQTTSALFTALLGETRTVWTASPPPADAEAFGGTGSRLVWIAGETVHLSDPTTGRTWHFTLGAPGTTGPSSRWLSPDGTLLARTDSESANRVEVVRISDDTATVLGAVNVDGGVKGVRFAADGKTFGVQTQKTLSLFATGTRKPLGPAIPMTGLWALDPSASHVAVTPSVGTQSLGDAAPTTDAGGSGDWNVSVFTVATAQRDTTVALDAPAAHLALSGDTIVVGLQDQRSARIPRMVEVYDRKTGSPTVASSPDTDVFALADGRVAMVEPGVITLWDPDSVDGSGTTFRLSEQPTFVWSSGGRLFAQGLKSVRSWDMTRDAAVVDGPAGPANIGRLVVDPRGSWIAVTDFGITDDSEGTSEVRTGSNGMTARVQTFLVRADTIGSGTLQMHGPVPGAVEMFVGSTVVVDGIRYSVPSLHRVSGPPIVGDRGRPSTISFDGTVGFYSDAENGGAVELSSGRVLGAIPPLTPDEAQTVALSHDGRQMAWFDASTSRLVVRAVKSQRAVADPIRVGQSTSVVAFGPDDDLAATGDNNGRVSLYRVSTGQLVWTAQGASAGVVQALSWSPDGRLIVASMDDQSTVLFQSVDGERLAGDLPAVRTTPGSFVDGGSALVIPTLLGVVRVELNAKRWPKLACTTTYRSLTDTEWQHYLPGVRYEPIC